MKYIKVIVDISADAVDRAYTYGLPDEFLSYIAPGVFVDVPFGRSNSVRTGLVTEILEKPDFDPSSVKNILAVSENRNEASAELICLAEELSFEYGTTFNQALKTVLPVRKRVRKNSRRTDPVEKIGANYPSNSALPDLTPAQKKVFEEIRSEKRTSLLYGITGSGKTRIYIELIKDCEKEGRECILLIPEISLGYQMVGELYAVFGEKIAIMHSKLSSGERYDEWQKAQRGEVLVMVGPRSAVFAPFRNLGLIIIDEEHERTYTSDTPPRYDTRRVASMRAARHGAKLLLASATPSLKSFYLAETGAVRLHTLSERAPQKAVPAKIHIVDMRKELMKGNAGIFSEKLLSLMEDRLSKNEQIMLFLNKRGFAKFASCRSCGQALRCPHCDVALAVHNSWYIDPLTGRRGALLSCHYCGYTMAMPSACPSCASRYIAPFGTGTEKLELAAKKVFPDARIARMDRDTTLSKESYTQILSAMKKRQTDILIGTQMIVKGHDFPFVTLMGIVAADMSLNAPEFDASERTFELITQASGRSGRGEIAGEVVIQTYLPEHYAVSTAATDDFAGFYDREMSYRKLMKYPPIVSMLSLGMRSRDEKLLFEASHFAEDFLLKEKDSSLEVFGPVNESIYKINDTYRKILYLKHERHDIIVDIGSRLSGALRERFSEKVLKLSYRID